MWPSTQTFISLATQPPRATTDSIATQTDQDDLRTEVSELRGEVADLRAQMRDLTVVLGVWSWLEKLSQ